MLGPGLVRYLSAVVFMELRVGATMLPRDALSINSSGHSLESPITIMEEPSSKRLATTKVVHQKS